MQFRSTFRAQFRCRNPANAGRCQPVAPSQTPAYIGKGSQRQAAQRPRGGEPVGQVDHPGDPATGIQHLVSI